jgi:hypothetical protein
VGAAASNFVAKHSAASAFDDDPWGFGHSDGVLVEVPAEAPVPLADALTVRDLPTSSAIDPPPPAPSWTRRRVVSATIGAAVTASVVTAAATWWVLRPPLPPMPSVEALPTPSPPVAADGAARANAPSAASVPASPAPPGAEAPPPSPAHAYGAVAFDAPFDLGVYRQGRFIGAVESTPLRVPAGTHTFQLVNERLGFRAWQTLEIVAGQATRRVVPNRTAPLTLDLQPPAEVLVDGHNYGEVSRTELHLPLGTRIVVVRHPTLGERTVPVSVALGVPNHISVNLER